MDLCDQVLDRKASRQHTFDFLRGDGTPGRKLPIDGYYLDINLAIEYHEKQHTGAVSFWDDRTTVSGVPRSKQRALYDQRRGDVLMGMGIRLLEINYADFRQDSKKRLLRRTREDVEVLR